MAAAGGYLQAPGAPLAAPYRNKPEFFMEKSAHMRGLTTQVVCKCPSTWGSGPWAVPMARVELGQYYQVHKEVGRRVARPRYSGASHSQRLRQDSRRGCSRARALPTSLQALKAEAAEAKLCALALPRCLAVLMLSAHRDHIPAIAQASPWGLAASWGAVHSPSVPSQERGGAEKVRAGLPGEDREGGTEVPGAEGPGQ